MCRRPDPSAAKIRLSFVFFVCGKAVCEGLLKEGDYSSGSTYKRQRQLDMLEYRGLITTIPAQCSASGASQQRA